MRRTPRFSEELRMKRRRAKLTQVELGEMIGLSGATIGHYETEVTRPNNETIRRLEELLGSFDCFKPDTEVVEVVEVVETKPQNTLNDTVTFLTEYVKFCDYHKPLKCSKCPLNSNNSGLKVNNEFTYCSDIIKYFPNEAIGIVKDWVNSNQKKEFTVIIEETISQAFTVTARNQFEAYDNASFAYRNGDLVVDNGTLLDYIIQVVEA